jgi:hypothetical protein
MRKGKTVRVGVEVFTKRLSKTENTTAGAIVLAVFLF